MYCINLSFLVALIHRRKPKQFCVVLASFRTVKRTWMIEKEFYLSNSLIDSSHDLLKVVIATEN